jgi:2-methylcitrate dehydratase
MSLTDDTAKRLCTAAPSNALAVEQIAAFTDQAGPDHLSSEIRQLFKRNILDSLGCALGALPGKPFARLRQQFADYRTERPCTLIGGGATSTDQAALYNTALARYVDLLDSYVFEETSIDLLER